MKKFLEIFFITLGVIFFVIILVVVYLFVADPFGIKPLIKTFTGSGVVDVAGSLKTNTSTRSNTAANPLLNAEQEKALKAIGIDPSSLPTEISPQMEKCFYEKLGEQRATEIKNGAAPTPIDLFKAKSCL